MSLQTEVLSEVQGLAERAIDGVIGAIERRRAIKEQHPCVWHAFHRRMWLRLPKIRWLARLHHRRKARRFEALCYAQRDTGDAVACALCDALEGHDHG